MLENSIKNTDALFRAFQRFWQKMGKMVALQKSNFKLYNFLSTFYLYNTY
jgi:hypothetical protein